jgi:prophage regulatory protein
MREPDRIIRLKTVLSRTGLSRSTIYRKIAEGTFPAQLKISTNGTGWHESDINRWIADPVSWRPKRQCDESDEAGMLPSRSPPRLAGSPTGNAPADARYFDRASNKTSPPADLSRRRRRYVLRTHSQSYGLRDD